MEYTKFAPLPASSWSLTTDDAHSLGLWALRDLVARGARPRATGDSVTAPLHVGWSDRRVSAHGYAIPRSAGIFEIDAYDVAIQLGWADAYDSPDPRYGREYTITWEGLAALGAEGTQIRTGLEVRENQMHFCAGDREWLRRRLDEFDRQASAG